MSGIPRLHADGAEVPTAKVRGVAVVVIHGEPMIAEGIAAALTRYSAIAVIGVATTPAGWQRCEERADAAVLDRSLPWAPEARLKLQSRGVRVVLLGESESDADALSVSTRAPIAALAAALVPGVVIGRRRSPLTRREGEVLQLIAAGLTAGQAARRLGISAKTVEQRKSRAFSKLGVTNQAAAVRVAMMSGTLLDGEWSRRGRE